MQPWTQLLQYLLGIHLASSDREGAELWRKAREAQLWGLARVR